MAEALARKKKVRAGHRSSATRLMHQLAEESDTAEGPSLDRLMQCKLTLSDKLQKLHTLDDEILALVDDEAVEDEIEQADIFKERIQQTVIRVERLITAKSMAPAYTPVPPTVAPSTSTAPTVSSIEAGVSTTTHDGTSHTVTAAPDTSDTVVTGTIVTPVTHPRVVEASTSKVKLPKLEPKRFNGDLTKWEAFWSTFNSAIHLNTTLSAVDKFTYLNSLLEGSAMRAIAGLKLSDANYPEAIDILKKRFGNKRLIINRHMDTLLQLESVSSVDNVKALRRLHDQVEFQVRSLKSLEVPLDSYGNLLSSLFMNRLPQELCVIISREIGDEEWNIDQLMDIVEREVSARERASAGSQVPGMHTTAALLTGDNQPKCSYCRQGHSSSSCTVVRDISQRKAILKRTGRCFVCLRRHHLSKDCRSSTRCVHCSGRHHSSICMSGRGTNKGGGDKHRSDSQTNIVGTMVPPQLPSNQHVPQHLNPQLPPLAELQPQLLSQSPGQQTPTTTQLYCVNTEVPVLLQTAIAYVHRVNQPECGIVIRLMLDGGSQRSYVTQKVKDALGLQPENTERVQIKTFGSESTMLQTVEVVRLAVPLKTGTTIQLILSTVPLICEPLSCQPIAYTKERYEHLADLDLADFSRVGDELQVDALIGSDHYWQLVTGEVIHGQSGPTAIHTHLGWVLSGPVCAAANVHNLHSSYSLLNQSSSTNSMDSLLKSFWELESLGIKPVEPSVHDTFKQSIKFEGGRYQVSLPWRSDQTRPPSNLQLAKRRLQGLLKRLHHHPEVLQEYHAILQEQLQLGIIEKVSNEYCESADSSIHYLPHHAVIRKDKQTTKLRIVYDASARDKGPSLNDCLFSGPKFDQNILDILLRFRMYKVALVADVEKAFLMISVCKNDRDVLRFLWVDDVTKPVPVIHEMRFTRVVFGVSASPFLLNATINHHLQKYLDVYPDLVSTLTRSIYVDDVTCGADGEEDAYKLYVLSKKVFADGGFNLRKFVTNSPMLNQKILSDQQCSSIQAESGSCVVEEDTTYSSSLLGGTVPGGQKVLGVRWNTVDDTLDFDIREIATSLHTLKPTKRNIIAFASRFYDPLGFLSPVIIMLKVFFQQLCKLKLEWDDGLPSELVSKWRSLVSRFRGSIIKLPRCYFCSTDKPSTTVLHGFCDASTTAYAAVVYICIGSDSAHFVTSKTRVAPINQQTIPRLELLSCLLLARLISHVFEALKSVTGVQIGSCFSDSMVALFWIRGEDKQWKQFVHNRVTEIRRLVPAVRWFHCPGTDNPADLPSRGISLQELDSSLMWRHGPDWLPRMPQQQHSEELAMPLECTTELKVKDNLNSYSLLISVSSSGIGAVMDCSRFCKLLRLLRVTVYVFKFVNCFKSLTDRDRMVDWIISAEDIEEAEMAWVSDCQKDLHSDTNFESWKCRLQLFTDESNVWRCGGRLTKADIPYSKRHPILLHKQHHFATLITEHAHERTGHSGVKDTLTEVRSKYWFVKGRQFVRKTLYKCVRCRKLEGKHYRAVPAPPLPEFRIKEAPPFAHCGVDYAGPLYIVAAEGSESEKVWICLFTCCITRAIHLELVPDMSTDTFIRAFKRFAARRGTPVQVISDNAKTFVSAAKHLVNIRVTWSFNLEKAPWWGGFFERMVQSVKRCLRKTIGRAKLTYDELSTVLTEVEAIVNSRPLSYLSSEDLDEPLTPHHLLTGRRLLSLPNVTGLVDRTDEDFVVNSDELNARVKRLTSVLEDYWIRWREEYLLNLRERYSAVDNVGVPRSPVPGEVVIVHDETHPRNFWKLGKVIDVIKGSDGQTRGAVLDVITNGKTVTLRRPITRLYPLEVMCKSMASSSEGSSNHDDTAQDETAENSDARPVRAAAQRARRQVLEWISDANQTDIM